MHILQSLKNVVERILVFFPKFRFDTAESEPPKKARLRSGRLSVASQRIAGAHGVHPIDENEEVSTPKKAGDLKKASLEVWSNVLLSISNSNLILVKNVSDKNLCVGIFGCQSFGQAILVFSDFPFNTTSKIVRLTSYCSENLKYDFDFEISDVF